MIRLQQHRWVELADGARVRLRPFDAVKALIARSSATRAASGIADQDIRQSVEAIEVTDATVAAHVAGWEGIGNDDGEPIEPTPELVIELLRTVPGARDALNGALQEMAEAWLTEKKTSRNSPAGSAGAVPPTAPNAGDPDRPAPTASQG